MGYVVTGAEHQRALDRIAELEAELSRRVDHGKRLREVELENESLRGTIAAMRGEAEG